MSEMAGMAFYVLPGPADAANPAWRIRHADETVHAMSAFFIAPHGEPVPGADGTYEVRAPAPSSVDMVRQMLTEHEGLIIAREAPLTGNPLADLLVTEEDPSSRTGIEPGYRWFGDEYKAVFRVYVDGHQVGMWTKQRHARSDLRYHLRQARRTARGVRR
jgi:hypothetical protein